MSKETKENISAAYEQIRILLDYFYYVEDRHMRKFIHLTIGLVLAAEMGCDNC